MKRIVAFALALFCVLSIMPAAFAEENGPLTVKDLNTDSTNGSHAKDYYQTASIEMSYRETVDLTGDTTGYSRYTNAWYPRVKKVKDDLFLMVYMYDRLGPHIYWNTSKDGVNWENPQVLFDNRTEDKKVTLTGGPLDGTADRLCAMTPDACVLANGDILCVYAVRPNKGYHDYPDLAGLYLVRGKVGADNTVTWGAHTKIYTGQAWEPYIWQHPDGRVEIYWTSIVAYASMYGFDEEKRSTCTMLITSEDNGATWTPNVQPGDTNHYVAYRVYNEYIGDRIPFGTNADGSPKYTEAVPYFGGQMPAATRLYDGRTMLALEVQKLDDSFDFSFATSDKNGKWKELGLLENGPANAQQSIFDAAGPYLARFPSGEVYLTYHWAGKQYYRLGDPEGTEFTARSWFAAPGKGGMWGSSELLSSHEVLTATSIEYAENKYGVQLTHSYLNHRVNAAKATVTVDGSYADWADNTDALFVGSESQAQMTVQTAHDADNVYFLINRVDDYLQEGDTVAVNIGVGKAKFYTVTADVNGTCKITYTENGVTKAANGNTNAVAKTFGTVGNNKDTDRGMLVELSVPKSLVGLSGAASFVARPELCNVDAGGTIRDTLTGVSHFVTALWPEVVLK